MKKILIMCNTVFNNKPMCNVILFLISNVAYV